jgi:predicted signal transduction protein with EAL and GGDEF domain
MLALEALLATMFAIWPPTDELRTINAVVAVVLVIAAMGCAVRPSYRGPLWLVEAWLVVAWGIPLVVIATRRIEASQLMWATILIPVAVVAAFYLPARRAAYQVAAIVAGYLVASLTFDPPTRPVFVFGYVVCIVVCAFAVAVMRRDRDRVLAEVEALATTDPLTGLLNRRGLDVEAGIVRSNAARAGRPTIVALLDLDGLKQRNDTLGHDAGDAFLVNVASH